MNHLASTQPFSGAELVVHRLLQLGVTTVFGYPGGAIMPLYDALYQSGITHILCRHEQGAGFAALGYAAASGKVGVCIATSGPGMTNLITALADANADSVPMVVITGQVSSQLIGTDAFQEVDVLGLSLSFCKHSRLVDQVDHLDDALKEAFEIAISGRKGVVLLDICKDVQLAKTTFDNELNFANVQQEICENAASDNQVVQVAEYINNARRPLLYIGGGAIDADVQLQELQIRLQLPSVHTLKGLGVLPSNPLKLGMLGMHGNRAANLATQSCDLLIAIGARFDDRVTGKLAQFAPKATVIHIDIDAAEINKLKHSDLAVKSDATKFISQILSVLSSKQASQSINRDAWLKLIHSWQESETSASLKELTPKAVFQHLEPHITKDSWLTTDVGQHQMWAAQYVRLRHPKQLITSGALGSMGFGLPAAIGAQLAQLNHRIFCISGDGSIMMNLQEMATAHRYNLPVKLILFDNSKLGMVRQWQNLFFEQRYSETDLSDNPDFVLLAKAFRWQAEAVDSAGELDAAVMRMVQSDKPYLLQIKISPELAVWPLVPPNQANENMLNGFA